MRGSKRRLTRAVALVSGLAGAASWAQAEAVRFAVIADYGTTQTSTVEVANLVKGWGPDFVVTAGDNWYGSEAAIDDEIGKHYHPFIYNYRGKYGPGSPVRRFYPALGNHDYHNGNANTFLNYFDLPGNERYYSFSQGPVEVFVLNSNPEEPDGVSSTSRQAQWLQSSMAASEAAWKIVVMHYPPYSSGTPFAGMRWPFEDWGASVVMASHHHAYERLSVGGLTYLVNGLGGAEKHGFDSSPDPNSVVRFNGDFGAQRVTADEGSMRLEFITRSGTVIDDYRIRAAGKYLLASATSWESAAAWQPAGVPVSGESCILRFEDGSARTITYTRAGGDGVQLARVRVDAAGSGSVTLAQARDTLKSDLVEIATGRSALVQSGGVLEAKRVVNRGAFTHAGGVLRIGASLLNAGVAVTISDGAQWSSGSVLENAGGTASLNATQQVPVVRISGGSVRMPGGGKVLVTDSLTVTGLGKLDAGENAVIVRSGSVEGVRSMLLQGRGTAPGGIADGSWDGNAGIGSAAAAGQNRAVGREDRVLGYALNGELVRPYEQFAGQAAGEGDVLIRFTSNADATLDGRVDNNDVTVVAGFFNPHHDPAASGVRHWHQGDFNWDGRVDARDITILAGFYAPASPPVAEARADAALVVVPEAGGGGALLALAQALLWVRWRVLFARRQA